MFVFLLEFIFLTTKHRFDHCKVVNAIQEKIIFAWKIGSGIKEGVPSLQSKHGIDLQQWQRELPKCRRRG